MAVRMLCTDCGRTARPDTWLEGSDRLELAGWLLGVLPGLLYCWWRHETRRKACMCCGGFALVRESRSARRRRPDPAFESPGRVRNASGFRRWPRPLRTPRERLRHGGAALSCLALSLAAFGLGLAPGAAGPAPWRLLPLAAAASLAWTLSLAIRLWRSERTAVACEAWDAQGRRIPIQALH